MVVARRRMLQAPGQSSLASSGAGKLHADNGVAAGNDYQLSKLGKGVRACTPQRRRGCCWRCSWVVDSLLALLMLATRLALSAAGIFAE